MRIFPGIMPLALGFALLAQSAFATTIYDRDFVRGFIALKGDFRIMNPKGKEFINRATGIIDEAGNTAGDGFSTKYIDGHVEIGAKYNSLRTWFDIDFMPSSITRTAAVFDADGNPDLGSSNRTRWYAYGMTWMWGYELLRQGLPVNIIPSMGFGFEFLNVRSSYYDRVLSCIGPALNLELELRAQIYQFSLGVYGGYKVVRHDGWDRLSQEAGASYPFSSPYKGDVNADKIFAGVKLSWTMLSNMQKRLMDLQ